MRLFLDVTLTAHWGLRSPVGFVRVEQYVAEVLSHDPSLELHFVIFDGARKAYRALTDAERLSVEHILHHRYQTTPLEKLAPVQNSRAPRWKSWIRRVARIRLLRGVVRCLRRLATTPSVPIQPASGVTPAAGDVLIVMSNLWNYMDFEYLDRLCRRGGVHLVSVVYDVIAMELPFVAETPAHVLHRYWVELGHNSSRLLAISQHSANRYRELIAEPNDLSSPSGYAHLPNFLKERADTIGEIPVADLVGKSFVLYCSTIEIRKNHHLLLDIWNRALRDVRGEVLPVLVFAGKWGWSTEFVRLHVERNWHLRDHLRMLEDVSDAELIWLYRNARFTVFPSYSEGFGLGAAESLSFGTPVVISNCPALIEATEGLMPAHDPQDFPAWYGEILNLATDDARVDELRIAAQQYRGPTYEEFAFSLRDLARISVN